jgi:hypothetical protein
MSRLGMSGAILLLPIYAFMARIREILHFTSADM